MSNTIPAFCLEEISTRKLKDVLIVKIEMAFKDPEVQAAFEAWKAKRDREAKNADKP